jgi:hypothetical protein
MVHLHRVCGIKSESNSKVLINPDRVATNGFPLEGMQAQAWAIDKWQVNRPAIEF